jgi:hypothetical protein
VSDDTRRDEDGRRTAMQVVVELRADLQGWFDVAEWNSFVAWLGSTRLLPPTWEKGEAPLPLGVIISLKGLRRPRYRLDGIDLSACWIEDASFDGASLRGMRAGCGRNVSYRGARLHGADFRGVEVSACDFAGATGIDPAMFEGAVFAPGMPPTGLPADAMAMLGPGAEPPPADPREPTNPREPSGFGVAPIRCHATIHRIPIED